MDDAYKMRVAEQLRAEGKTPQEIADYLNGLDVQIDVQQERSFVARATQDLSKKLTAGKILGPNGEPL